MADKARAAGKGTVVSHRARSRKFLFAAAIAPALPMLGGEARGQIAYTTPGSLYTQDFNTLPASDAATPPYTIGAGKVPYQVPAQPDLSGLLTGTYTGLPGWHFTDSSPSSTTHFTVDNTSSSTAGSTYSYAHGGTNGLSDRALGAISSAGEQPMFGFAIQNNTGSPLTSFSLGFRGEQYRLNTATQGLNFHYLIASAFDPNDLINFEATQVHALNFNPLRTPGAAGIDGNAAGNFANIASSVTGFTLNPGEILWLKWWKSQSNSAGLAIDDIVFSAYAGAPGRNLVWNPPATTWMTGGSTNWLDVAAPASWADNDNAIFTNAGAGPVNIDPAGVTVNSVTINHDSDTNYVFSGGPIAGAGALTKTGSGIVEFTASNTYAGGTTLGGGAVITSAPTALGSGKVAVTGFTILETATDLTTGGIAGSAPLVKIGLGTLTVNADSGENAGGTIQIVQGKLRMNHRDALGGAGATAAPAMAITLAPGTDLETAFGNASGFRLSGSITLDSATITRPDGTVDGDSTFDAYVTGTHVGGTLTVLGYSVIRNLEQATGAGAGAETIPGNSLALRMPVNIASGATLTLHAANTLGDFGSNAVSIRGVTDFTASPNDAITLQPGATLQMTGPGEKRIGADTVGKPIIGKGTSAGDSVIKLDPRTFLTDIAASNTVNITRLVVAGAGEGGLRIEAPMNASYMTPIDPAPAHPAPADGFLGLFGLNTTSTQEGGSPPAGYSPIGNAYTVMSPRRYNQLSAPFGNPLVTPGGTLTLAATDPTGATGVIDNGPDAPAPIKLALDNTAASGDLTYVIDPAANAGKFANFAGLSVKRTHAGAGAVTAKLLPNGSTVLRTPTLTLSGARLDLADNKLITTSPVGTFIAGAYTGIAGLVDSARGDLGAPMWDGSGLTTSDPRAQQKNLITIGVAKAGDIKGVTDTDTATFAGQTVLGSDTIAMVTWGGDATLDGKINIDDYGRIDANVSQSGTVFGWFNGDFNYDGAINIDDYGIIDGNISNQGDAFPTSAAADGVSAIPEPVGLGVLMIAGALLHRRRSC